LPLLYESYAAQVPRSLAKVKDTEKTVTIIVGYPSSSIQLSDSVTKKPIQGAKVAINSTEKVSDSSGMVSLEMPDGEYTVKISHPSYWKKTVTVKIPMAEPLKVELWPLWAIGLGIVAGATVATVVISKAVWK